MSRTGVPAHRAFSAAAAALALVAGCQLQEIAVPLGREEIAVHGVLTCDSNATAQYIVVERTITGTMTIPDLDSLRGLPQPPLPVSGALVVVTRDDGDSVLFAEGRTPGVYALPGEASRPFLVPGRVYRLRVDVPDGRQVRGQARMPAPPLVTGMPATGATFDRDHDTLRLSWSGAQWSDEIYVQVRPRDVQRRLTLALFTDSTSLVIPGKLPLPVLGDTIPPSVWVAGSYQTLTVAAIDTNYFDHLRTQNDPFTGGGYIGHLEGALGLFGAIAPVNRTVVVRGDVDHPFEGRYVLRMVLDGDSLAGEVELYVTRERPEPVLVNGIVSATLVRAAGGPPQALVEVQASGRVSGGRLQLRVTEGGTIERGTLTGGFSATGSASGIVLAPDQRIGGTYMLTRLP
jgi:hypothetical protein